VITPLMLVKTTGSSTYNSPKIGRSARKKATDLEVSKPLTCHSPFRL
jgi:hypothetical protein